MHFPAKTGHGIYDWLWLLLSVLLLFWLRYYTVVDPFKSAHKKWRDHLFGQVWTEMNHVSVRLDEMQTLFPQAILRLQLLCFYTTHSVCKVFNAFTPRGIQHMEQDSLSFGHIFNPPDGLSQISTCTDETRHTVHDICVHLVELASVCLTWIAIS